MHPPEQPVYNKDEAERVRDLGVETLHRGDATKALWWFNKSKKLYSLDGIEEWIQKATKLLSHPKPEVKQAPPPPQETPAPPPPEVPKNYTEEQIQIVNRIIGFVDYYDKLSLQSTATDDEIRKQFRQV